MTGPEEQAEVDAQLEAAKRREAEANAEGGRVDVDAQPDPDADPDPAVDKPYVVYELTLVEREPPARAGVKAPGGKSKPPKFEITEVGCYLVASARVACETAAAELNRLGEFAAVELAFPKLQIHATVRTAEHNAAFKARAKGKRKRDADDDDDDDDE